MGLGGRVILGLAVVGVTLDLAIAATTLLPGAPWVPQWPQFALFPFIFVVHFSSVLRIGRRPRPSSWTQVFAGLPRIAYIVFVCLFACAMVAFLTSMTGGLTGQPTASHGRYFLDDHGVFQPVTHAAYEHALVLQQRIFTMIPAVFFAAGVAVHYPRRGLP